MRYATAAAFRTALEQRLLASSRQRDGPLALLRKLVAFERLLARLLVVAPDRWVLKGAVALHFRLG
ncbi:MAG TPA: nucleotidyl transferase AbiEii/AbiGii toxin family protein, partial [Chloroflexota bacterium]|nr:nucleotidyl transferase AbiEii/AbiGii toxin family protein [Chloroflexota bacterium]